MSKPSFVYVIYIHAEPEQVWQALIDPEFTRVYWLHDNVSDWQVGSKWEHRRADDGSGTVDIVGEVEEFDRPRRMVLTWAEPADAGKPEKTSRVTFEIEPQEWPGGPWVSLRIIHSELEPESEMLANVSWGWPALGSSLKTLLESPDLMRLKPEGTTLEDYKR